MVHINNLQGLYGSELATRGKVFVVFETSPNKRPVKPQSWSNKEDLLTWDQAIAYIEKEGSETLRVAMVLNGDGWVCIDGDKILDAEGKIKPEWVHVGDELDSISVSEVSVSGNGVHWFCRSDSTVFKSHATEPLGDGSHLDGWNGLDAKGQVKGRCVILTGEAYKGIGSHFWSDHSEVIDDFVKEKFEENVQCKVVKENGQRTFKPTVELNATGMDDWTRGKLVIEKIMAEEGTFGDGQRNDKMFRFTGGLRKYVRSEEVVLSLALTANERLCSPPLCPEEVRKITKNSGEYGRPRSYEPWSLVEDIFAPNVGQLTDEIIKQFSEIAKEQKQQSEINYKTDLEQLYNEEGIIGEVMRYAAKVRPHFVMPQADLSTALFSMATLCCGKFRTGVDEGNTWPNLYGVYVTNSGIGKDTNKQVVSAVGRFAGLGERLQATNISSAQGWLRSYSFEVEGGQPIQTTMLDEWADMLPQQGRNPSDMWQAVMRYLKDYYQTCGRGKIKPSVRMDDSVNFYIEDISPTIFGLTQPKVWQRISPEMLSDGFAGRHLFFGDSIRGGGEAVLKKVDPMAPIYKSAYDPSLLPEPLKQMIKELIKFDVSGHGGYYQVPFSYEARKWFNEQVGELNRAFALADTEEGEMDSTERRSFDKVTRLGVLLAVSEEMGYRVRNGKASDPFCDIDVEVRHAKLAWSIAMDCLEYAKHCVTKHSGHEDCQLAVKLVAEVESKVIRELEKDASANLYVMKSRTNTLRGIDPKRGKNVLDYVNTRQLALVEGARIIPAKYVEQYRNSRS